MSALPQPVPLKPRAVEPARRLLLVTLLLDPLFATLVATTGNSLTANASVATVQATYQSSFDTAAAIPLRNHIYRGNDFCVSLTGSAIGGPAGTAPYEVLFDTGSWTTSLPYGILDKTKITVLEKNIKDGWGNLADKVKGQLILTSRDGKTKYAIDDYVFFALKKTDGSDAPDDRKSKWSRAILGAFPSATPWGPKLPSLPYAIAQKYSPPNEVGLGIISAGGSDIASDWDECKAYLKIGNDPKISARLNWRNDVPLFRGRSGFIPEAVPGFTVTFSFPKVNGQTVADIVVSNLIATIDTGAPELNMRVGSNNPHRQVAYQTFFTDKGPGWMKAKYKADSLCAASGVAVRIGFTGSSGHSSSYQFTTSAFGSAKLPTHVIVGDWSGMVPWPVGKSTPENRINLGNTIYFYCPVYFWDITHKRVGIYFK
jgi:hypothetical protein